MIKIDKNRAKMKTGQMPLTQRQMCCRMCITVYNKEDENDEWSMESGTHLQGI